MPPQRSDPSPPPWRSPGALLALTLCWLGFTAGLRPLLLPDEGRYVGVAWEMLRSGDWLTPTLNGLPFFHKPPLFYWITAASMSVFGLHEWAARLAPVLGATLGAFSLFLFLRRWVGEREARLSLAVLLVQPLFFVGGQFANLDMLVAGCITATISLAAHAALGLEAGERQRPAIAGAWAMAAAGVLAKGLIGVVLPALVVLAWLLALRRWKAVRGLMWWPAMLLFLVIAAPWFWAMQLRYPDFLHYFFVVQHFKRYAAGGFNNVQPLWFYPVVLMLFSLPCLPWVWRLLARDVRADTARRPVRLLLGLWLGLVLLFFSLPASKLLGYVLPAVPPLAALIADGYARWPGVSARAGRWWRAGLGGSALVGLATVAGLALWPPHSLRSMGSALAAQHRPGQTVFVVGKYVYDLPFYARLSAPVRIVGDWADADARAHDDWRKELVDAADFDQGSAAWALLPPEGFAAALCAAPISWVVGAADAAGTFAFLSLASPVARASGEQLWRVDLQAAGMAAALGCAGRKAAAIAPG